MKEIFDVYQKVGDRIKTTKGALQTFVFTTGKNPDKIIDKVQSKYDIVPDKYLLYVLKKHGGFGLSYMIENDAVRGSVFIGRGNILDAEYMLNGPLGVHIDELNIDNGYQNVLWDDKCSEHVISHLEKSVIFDYSPYNVFTILSKDENSDDLKLFLYIYPNTLEELKISIKDYYFNFFYQGGIFLWQAYFTNNPNKILHAYNKASFYRQYKYIFDNQPSIVMDTIEKPPTIPIFEIMQKQDYRVRLDSMVESLRKNKNIKEVSFEADYGVSDAALYKAEKKLGHELPDQLKAFYKTVNGFSLSWSTKNSLGLKAVCSLDFFSLEWMFGGEEWEYKLNWDYSLFQMNKWTERDERLEPQLSKFRDYRVMNTQGTNSVLLKFDSKEEVGVSIIEKWDHHPLGISFEEYIDTLIGVRGMKFWEYHLKSIEGFEDRDLLPDFHKQMEILFPDVSLYMFK